MQRKGAYPTGQRHFDVPAWRFQVFPDLGYRVGAALGFQALLSLGTLRSRILGSGILRSQEL